MELIPLVTGAYWPLVAVLFLFLFRREIGMLLQRLLRARLPGADIEFEPTLRESEKMIKAHSPTPQPSPSSRRSVSYLANQWNKRLQALNFEQSPSGLETNHYAVAAKDLPEMALSGLRGEIEIGLRNLAKWSGLKLRP